MDESEAGFRPHAPEARRTYLEPGRDGRAFFLELLGTDLDGWEFERLRLLGAAIELTLVKKGERVSFELSHPRPDRPSPTSTRALAVHLRGSRDSPRPQETRLARAVFARFSSTTFADLLKHLRHDALLYSDAHHPDVPSRLDRFHRRPDHSADWWKFFYPDARHLEQDVRLRGKVVRVSHGTAECRLNNPQLPIRSLRYFADERRAHPADDAKFIDTALTEGDVLAGRTMTRLSEALDEAASLQPEVVHVMTTCLPELIGDDPRPLFRKLEGSKTTVCWSSKTRDPAQSFDQLIRRMLGELTFASERDPDAVLLAGVPSARAAREATALLAGLGLRVVGELLPTLALSGSDGSERASAVVWLSPSGWEKIGNEPFLKAGLAVVRSHPPFGHAGTREWLHRICQVLGRDPAGVDRLGGSEEALATCRKQCRERRLALVGDRADLDILVSRGRALGLSVAAVLCDMGFRVACFVYDPSGTEAPREAPRDTGAGSIEFIAFSTRAQLDALLREADAVFTHFSHDPRLAGIGVPGFCEDVFEPGFQGMVRSAQRILHRAATRAFRRQDTLLSDPRGP